MILTGSFLPEKFKDSDADFNLGMALGAALASALEVSHDEKSSQVLIALNGLLIPAYRATRNSDGMFMIKEKTIFTWNTNLAFLKVVFFSLCKCFLLKFAIRTNAEMQNSNGSNKTQIKAKSLSTTSES